MATGNPHLEEQDGCDHGHTGKECKPDPQPTHGADCETHGNHGGINEDHCLNTTITTTTTAPSSTTTTTTTTSPTTTTTVGSTTTPTTTLAPESPSSTTTTVTEVPVPIRLDQLPHTGLSGELLVLGSGALWVGLLLRFFTRKVR